nr:unnamed protein product [Callosobruchus chinensis]
MPTQIT